MCGKRGPLTVSFRGLKLRHDFQLFFALPYRQTGNEMIPILAGMVPDRSAVLLRISSLLLFALTPAIAEVQSHGLTIRIINAKTGEPVTDERLNVALKVDQIGSVAMATDKNGIIAVDTEKATIIRILSNMYADCRPRGELYTNYSIATIMKSGITTGNLCSNAQKAAKPGELILYEIPKTYIPTMQH